jgi:hypothetical protein
LAAEPETHGSDRPVSEGEQVLEPTINHFFGTRVMVFSHRMIPKGLTGGFIDFLEALGPREVGKIAFRQGFVVFSFENYPVWDPPKSVTST